MTHTFMQLTNRLFISQLIFAAAAVYFLGYQGQTVSVWHWIVAAGIVYAYSAVLTGIVWVLSTRSS